MTLEELHKKSDNWDFIVRDGEIKESWGYSSDICTGDTVLKLDNLIEIPDGATNGDVIKAMFPYGEYGTNGDFVHVYIPFGSIIQTMTFDLSWWNTRYDKEVRR